MAVRLGQTERGTLGTGDLDRLLEPASSFTSTEMCLRGALKTTKQMERASTDIKVVRPTMVIGLTIFSMEMESKFWKMGQSTQVNLEMGRSMVWALIPGLTVRITKASGVVTK